MAAPFWADTPQKAGCFQTPIKRAASVRPCALIPILL